MFPLLFSVFLFLAADSMTANSQETLPAPSQDRAALVALVRTGYLQAFEDDGQRATFRALIPASNSHQPGMLEDEVIESAARTKIATDARGQKLRMVVACQSGKVTLDGLPEELSDAAALIDLVFGVDGVREITIRLPPCLRYRQHG